jgi:hypothetical protein
VLALTTTWWLPAWSSFSQQDVVLLQIRDLILIRISCVVIDVVFTVHRSLGNVFFDGGDRWSLSLVLSCFIPKNLGVIYLYVFEGVQPTVEDCIEFLSRRLCVLIRQDLVIISTVLFLNLLVAFRYKIRASYLVCRSFLRVV